ncbi:prepilin-type N-terminal cleavage/methylation domain-containing protein [Gemella cuniculi]|uniref:prepilin-type N-terminal cleavage/methylation domain-containing protein n=1 Tax=Gemella cuniculi TaxID=150240 RepID=UPI000415435A|nr:prepilin-type N-terminal cleavage/methylation domain-containing protein [Gemella cuniculi]
MNKRKQGFTLLELTVSLFLLIILSLLLMLILKTTLTTSRNFLNFTNYEYAVAHKKIFEIYNSSDKVERESNYIIMTSEKDKVETKLIFQGNRVYIEKMKNTNSYAGYILLLKNLKSYSITQNNNVVKIYIEDRSGIKRDLCITLKDKNSKEDNERDEKEI